MLCTRRTCLTQRKPSSLSQPDVTLRCSYSPAPNAMPRSDDQQPRERRSGFLRRQGLVPERSCL